MKRIVSTLLCRLRGHRRGKRITPDSPLLVCPRCGEQWVRIKRVKS